jgi:hypothetical protein
MISLKKFMELNRIKDKKRAIRLLNSVKEQLKNPPYETLDDIILRISRKNETIRNKT